MAALYHLHNAVEQHDLILTVDHTLGQIMHFFSGLEAFIQYPHYFEVPRSSYRRNTLTV